MKDLINQRFDRLKVIGESITFINSRNKTERKWLCRCDCGTEKYILERSLLSGNTTSCGCATRERSVQATAYDLQGKVFGDLTVLGLASNHAKDSRRGRWWHCRCSCGNECDVLASLLVTGKKTHCGCKHAPNYHYEDISDKTFGRLTAKYPLPSRDKKGSVIWHCECTCGNSVDVPYNWLLYSNMSSCGCLKKEHNDMMQDYLTRIGGTSIDIIKSKKIPTNNTSGVKGVGCYRGRYYAKIVFQKKQYHLGQYDNIEEAIRARKDAEELLFDGAAAHYEKWKAKADMDPQWGEQNPIQILVSKKSTNELSVVFFPVIE